MAQSPTRTFICRNPVWGASRALQPFPDALRRADLTLLMVGNGEEGRGLLTLLPFATEEAKRADLRSPLSSLAYPTRCQHHRVSAPQRLIRACAKQVTRSEERSIWGSAAMAPWSPNVAESTMVFEGGSR
ncbi:unnamed protein product [Diplocarpon coronariae]